MSAFTRVITQFRHSQFVIPLTLAVLLGLVIGVVAFAEDYLSSLYGYQLLPTRKSGQAVVQVIALLPQVGQIIFFYLFVVSLAGTGGRRRVNYLYFLIALCLLLFDLGTDMYFKASGQGWLVWLIALVESITVFTIGSELLLTASVGLLLELAPEALNQLATLIARLLGEEPGEEPETGYVRR